MRASTAIAERLGELRYLNFYWDYIPGRRLNPDQVDSQKALEREKAHVPDLSS
jgi:hypothetical protein